MAEKRIAIIIELAIGYREDVIAGFLRFIQTKPDWIYQGCELRRSELLALRKWRPDGIVVGFHAQETGLLLRKFGVPIVDVYNWLDLKGAVRVGVDESEVGRMAAGHLLQRGFKHLAIIGETSAKYSTQRRDGFLEILQGAGLSCHRIGDVAVPTVSWSVAFRTAPDKMLRKWLRGLPKPLGLFAVDDDWALTMSELCRQESIRVPEDVAILGVDNEEFLCRMSRPPLSSIDTGAERIGWAAGNILSQLMDRKSVANPSLLPPVRVVERQSTDIFAIEDQDVLAAIRFIQANAHRGIGVTEVLRTVPTRRRTLEHRFRELLGRSILDEIRRSRITRTKALLATTDLKLSAVAQRSGFNSAIHLCRVFRQVTGETPATFRRHQALE